MKRNMNRVKNSQYPKNPKTCEELKAIFTEPDILNKYGYNLDITEALYIDDVDNDEYGFCLFASQSTINIVRLHIETKKRKYLIDGTFSCALKLFYQLLIISIEFNNDVSIVRLFENKC